MGDVATFVDVDADCCLGEGYGVVCAVAAEDYDGCWAVWVVGQEVLDVGLLVCWGNASADIVRGNAELSCDLLNGGFVVA